tara:strand:+ start:734 stop:919 length:186 start_codon:yes stop_codon:yes gene_type:complete
MENPQNKPIITHVTHNKKRPRISIESASIKGRMIIVNYLGESENTFHISSYDKLVEEKRQD